MLVATAAGNCGRDAETRTLQSGDKVTSWSVAVEQRVKGGEKATQWLDCSMWGERGEKVGQYIKKGGKVTVMGELSTREHEGRTYLQIRVSEVTLQGGKNADSGQSSPHVNADEKGMAVARQGGNAYQDRRDGKGQEPQGGGDAGRYYDDEIPFAPEKLA